MLHELYRKYITETTVSIKKYDYSEKFAKDVNCKICLKELPVERAQRLNHLYNHFKPEIRDFDHKNSLTLKSKFLVHARSLNKRLKEKCRRIK